MDEAGTIQKVRCLAEVGISVTMRQVDNEKSETSKQRDKVVIVVVVVLDVPAAVEVGVRTRER